MPTIRSHEFNADDFIRIANEHGLFVKKCDDSLIVIDNVNDETIHWGHICASFDSDLSELCLYNIEPFLQYEKHAFKHTNIFCYDRKNIDYDKSLEIQLNEHLTDYIKYAKLYKKLIRFKDLSEL